MTIQITIENVTHKIEHLHSLLASAQGRADDELDCFIACKRVTKYVPASVLEDLANATARVEVLVRAVEILESQTYDSPEDALEDVAMTLLTETRLLGKDAQYAVGAVDLAREILFSPRIRF